MKRAIFTRLERLLAARRPAVVVSVIAAPTDSDLGAQMLVTAEDEGPIVHGSLGTPARDAIARAAAIEALASLTSCRIEPSEDVDGATLFVDVHAPPRTLMVVGAVHVAIPLVAFARTLDWRTVVIDPRTAFATPERFPDVDVLSHDWPDEALDSIGVDAATYLATLSHDDKLDVPALAAALRSPVRYIGALGSRKTHAKRVTALRDLGFDDAQLARIHNPIGLPLGGRRAEEIAVSILAEIVAVDHGRAEAVRDRA